MRNRYQHPPRPCWRALELTRARVTQLFDLLMLAADLQEQVLALEAVDGAAPMAEQTLRRVAREYGVFRPAGTGNCTSENPGRR